MKTIVAWITIISVLGSPLWFALIIRAIPRRWWPLDVVVCCLQALIAYFLWWLFWGDGIGVEADLSPKWMWFGICALLPLYLPRESTS